MYAPSQDELMAQAGSNPSSFSQLYPYHQQVFHQQYYGGAQPPVSQHNFAQPWSQIPSPPPLQSRQRPPYPHVSTSFSPVHEPNRMYSSPQNLYHGTTHPVPNPAPHGPAHPPVLTHRPTYPGHVGPSSTFSNPNQTAAYTHPQSSPQIVSSSGQHQSYSNHAVQGQYAIPPRHHHNHHRATMPIPQPSVAPVDHVPSYSQTGGSYAGAAPVEHQSLSLGQPPPPPENEVWHAVEEKPPLPLEDEKEIALAVAMSQADMLRKKDEEERLSNQEEEELARALAESLQMAEGKTHLFGGESSRPSDFTSQLGGSHQNNEDLSPLQLPINLPSEVPSYFPASSQNSTPWDENVGLKAHAWQSSAAYNTSQEGPSGATNQLTNSPSSLPYATGTSSYSNEIPQDRLDHMDLPVYSDRLSSSLAAMESLQRTETDESRLVFDDEAYARQLLTDEEDELRRRIEEKGRIETERQQRPERDNLPQYTSAGLLSPDLPPRETSGSSRRPSNANEVPQSMQQARIAASSSSQVSSPPPPNEPMPPLQSVNSNTSSTLSTQSPQGGRPATNQQVAQTRPHASSVSSTAAGPSNVPQLSRHSSAGVVNPNHFLDRELLAGVSIGFKPPALSMKLDQMEDPMPNIISLPSKKCPPLHLQTPNWGHMLRLLARSSNTRIEPTIEAMSDTKAQLKLRTVIQFIQPHPQALNVWRTILWFTIDQPVPPTALGAARYTSGNPNVLPWSYTLSPLPVLLRGASDTSVSKTYTIPATDAIPWPTLPISFPNLALYLHAVLEESRRHSRSDALAGIGKLGKMVQISYPSVREDDDDDGLGRSSVAGLLKRVMGRGNKDKNKAKSNNETYQMVIPYVSDGWG